VSILSFSLFTETKTYWSDLNKLMTLFLAELFVVQWMFDTVQLDSDQINLLSYHADTSRLLSYIKGLYEGLNESLASVKYVYIIITYLKTFFFAFLPKTKAFIILAVLDRSVRRVCVTVKRIKI